MSGLLAALVALAVFAAARLALTRRSARRLERLVRTHVGAPAAGVRPEPPRTASQGGLAAALDAVEDALEGRRRWERFVLRVERAGVAWRPAAVLAAVAAATLVLLLAAAATGSPEAAVLALAAPAVLTWSLLGVRAQRRLRAFDAQLPDLLSGLGASLRAGHGFLQCLQAVAADLPDPAGRELRRALAEARLGRPVEDALADVGRRVPSRDFVYVLTAIAVQREVGGSLAGLFETVNDTVRQRQQFARKVRALTATGRTSAYTLVALPVGVALLLSLVDHAYLAPLFATHVGRLMLLVSTASMVVGTVVVRRIVSFEA